MDVAKLCKEMDCSQGDDTWDLKKFRTVHLFQILKSDNKIADVFTLLSSKNKHVRSICILKITEIILNIDHGLFSEDELMNLFETGTVQLITAIAKTKKTLSIFKPLIELGIIFNCFIYLNAIEAKDRWIPRIRHVTRTMKSKTKEVMEMNDPDVQVFVKTVKCVFDLENVNLYDSIIFEEDMDDFLPELSKENNHINDEGLAILFHTGNLILRQQSTQTSNKLKAGVQKLVELSSFMKGSNDDGMVKWFHRLLGQFVVRILQQEHPDVKQHVLDRCEDQLFLILKREAFHSEDFTFSQCLLFHHNENIRTKYRDIANTRGVKVSNAVTEIHIQGLLKKFGLLLEVSSSESQVNCILERKQCTLCDVDASVTCFYETFQEESAECNMYDNTSAAKYQASENQYRKENLENELEVLKEIESNDFHINVVRLLAFNQSLPKFYIKERLPGDNLQRRLLEAREKGNEFPIVNLIRVIIQAVNAVVYVHGQGCLLRDITTASYGCSESDNGYFLKLKNFEMAVKPSEFSDGGIISGVIDMDFSGVPVRWAAPESLLEGHYSIYSDVWSVNILADEILNYAAWPYSDISDADINDMVTNIVFTHLKPQGFNRPWRMHGLILEGLANVPEQRLKLEALRERLQEILSNIDEGETETLYDIYSGVGGIRIKKSDIPQLTERQRRANSVFERGIPASVQRYRELEDPKTAFALEVAEKNSRLKEQTGLKLIEISSDENYKIESESKSQKLLVIEKVTDDFLKFTYNKLNKFDSTKMCVEPWPPSKSASADGCKLHYRLPGSTRLLDIVLHKDRGVTIDPYIELLYELANHVDAFHSAGWIFRCLRAKNVWILDSKKGEQTIVVPSFGKYRTIVSSEFDTHLEQIKVDSKEDLEGVQWLPIETIKARLWSKESDVYAFGMVTWEVMTAFGQDGVVYDQDEEREMACVPFSYQQSENVLQHLIEGYIPEKPLKCPDWFYQEVTRPCLLHQKIDRPSMKIILGILQTRLCKTLPRQIMDNYCSKLEISNDDFEYEEIIHEYDDCDVSPTLSQSYIAESKAPTAMKGNVEEGSQRSLPLPSPPSNLQKLQEYKPDVSNCSFPPDTQRFRNQLALILKNKKGPPFPKKPAQPDKYNGKDPDVEVKQVNPYNDGLSLEQNPHNQSSDSKPKTIGKQTVIPLENENICSREPTSANKTNPNPKVKPVAPFYVSDQETKAGNINPPVYINQPETKPAIPPRKPLKK